MAALSLIHQCGDHLCICLSPCAKTHRLARALPRDRLPHHSSETEALPRFLDKGRLWCFRKRNRWRREHWVRRKRGALGSSFPPSYDVHHRNGSHLLVFGDGWPGTGVVVDPAADQTHLLLSTGQSSSLPLPPGTPAPAKKWMPFSPQQPQCQCWNP